MMALMVYLSLLPTAPPDARVGTEVSDVFTFHSTLTKGTGAQTIITETLTNRGAAFSYSLQHGGRGTLPAVGLVGKSVTVVRASYRSVKEDVTSLTLTVNGKTYEHSSPYWVEPENTTARAFPGGRLEAKLIDGDEKGKVLVRCASRITGDEAKGYTYTYSVENLTDRPVRFKWAGMEGEVGPKKSFTKSEQTDKLTKEQSEILTLDFGDKREFAIRAHLWAMPK